MYGYGRPVVQPGYRPAPGMPMPMGGMRQPGYGVDVNRDGIVDYRVKPGVAVDVNRDGIPDYRTPTTIQPGPGMARPYGGYGGYGGYRY